MQQQLLLRILDEQQEPHKFHWNYLLRWNSAAHRHKTTWHSPFAKPDATAEIVPNCSRNSIPSCGCACQNRSIRIWERVYSAVNKRLPKIAITSNTTTTTATPSRDEIGKKNKNQFASRYLNFNVQCQVGLTLCFLFIIGGPIAWINTLHHLANCCDRTSSSMRLRMTPLFSNFGANSVSCTGLRNTTRKSIRIFLFRRPQPNSHSNW